MQDTDTSASFRHTFAMSPFSAWVRLLRENGRGDAGYRGRLAGVLLASAAAAPLRLAERAVYGRRVRRTDIDPPPLMILGYGRSGTTHLHNLLAQDPGHGSVTTLQCIAPTFFLLARAAPRSLLAGLVPSTRPMDNMRVALDLPQEEEVALANATHMSFLHHLSFPRNAARLHRRYALMEGLDDREMRRWERTYLDIVRKAAFHAPGRRIVLKSPSNLARIPHVLRIFPEARFVNIVRNPFAVYSSLANMFRKLIPIHQLQDVEWDEVERLIVDTYRTNMKRYLLDRSLIPRNRLVEMRFEDLESAPAAELRRVYDSLELDGWDAAEKPVKAYLDTLEGYRKNRFRMDAATAERVSAEWGFALDEWGYDPSGARP